MAEYKSFKSVFTKIERDIKSSQTQAVKKATTSTRALLAKEVAAETGLSSAKVKGRTKIINNQSTLSIGIKVPFAAAEFKPKKTKVMSSKGIRYGATTLVKGKGRQLVPAAITTMAKNGKALVLTRVGSKMLTVRQDVFRPIVERLVPTLQSNMKAAFEKNFRSILGYKTGKK